MVCLAQDTELAWSRISANPNSGKLWKEMQDGIFWLYGHFSPWLDRSKTVRSNQKLVTQAEFGLVVGETTRNNLYAHWSELTWSDLTTERSYWLPSLRWGYSGWNLVELFTCGDFCERYFTFNLSNHLIWDEFYHPSHTRPLRLGLLCHCNM